MRERRGFRTADLSTCRQAIRRALRPASGHRRHARHRQPREQRRRSGRAARTLQTLCSACEETIKIKQGNEQARSSERKTKFRSNDKAGAHPGEKRTVAVGSVTLRRAAEPAPPLSEKAALRADAARRRGRPLDPSSIEASWSGSSAASSSSTTIVALADMTVSSGSCSWDLLRFRGLAVRNGVQYAVRMSRGAIMNVSNARSMIARKAEIQIS